MRRRTNGPSWSSRQPGPTDHYSSEGRCISESYRKTTNSGGFIKTWTSMLNLTLGFRWYHGCWLSFSPIHFFVSFIDCCTWVWYLYVCCNVYVNLDKPLTPNLPHLSSTLYTPKCKKWSQPWVATYLWPLFERDNEYLNLGKPPSNLPHLSWVLFYIWLELLRASLQETSGRMFLFSLWWI